jgi:hypothetical protein
MIKDARACGCCEGIEALTPQSTANRPGLSALAYRMGTHATFLETMKARLSTLCLGTESSCQAGIGPYPLRQLTTRLADDPAIALLDAWAMVADVLTFYQERIANEGYLLTATERSSILELARLIGYRLRPGVAASTYLAFGLEAGAAVEIPAGSRAQSVPGPGELPQPFETGEPIQARAAWNELKPRLTQPQVMTTSTHTVYLKGLGAVLKPNDPALVLASTDAGEVQPLLRRVYQVEPEPDKERTKVLLVGDLNLESLKTLFSAAPPKVKEMPRPPQPTKRSPGDPPAQVPLDGDVTLLWDFDEGVDQASFKYNIEIKDAYHQSVFSKEGYEDNSYTLSPEDKANLNPGAGYSWTVTVISTGGCSTTAGPWYFQTAGNPPPGSPGAMHTGTAGSTPPPSPLPDFGGKAEDAANWLVEQTWKRLNPTGWSPYSLLALLKDPNAPADKLEVLIEFHVNTLTEEAHILRDLGKINHPCKDFTPVIGYIDKDAVEPPAAKNGLVQELQAVKDQLGVRRAVPSSLGRLYPTLFIDPGKVVDLINHRWNGAKVQFSDGDQEHVKQVGEPGFTRLLDHLATLIEDKLLDDTVPEDDKILGVAQQFQEAQDLQGVFSRLGIEGVIPGTDGGLAKWFEDLLGNQDKIGILHGLFTTKEPSTTTVPSLIPPLLKVPSLPPANALRLERKIKEIFAPGRDIAPRLLTTFQRQLQDTFYQALSEVEAKPLPPEQGFEALRVKAAPFGARAPLKPIQDSSGAVIGHKEWLLLGGGVHLSFTKATSARYTPPIQVEFLLTQDAETRYVDCGITLDEANPTGRCTLQGTDVVITLNVIPPGAGTAPNKYSISINGLGKNIIQLSGDKLEIVNVGEAGKVYHYTFLTNETRVDTIDSDLVTITTTSTGQRPTLLIDSFSMRPLPSAMRKVLDLDAEYNQISRGGRVVIEWAAGEDRPDLLQGDADLNLLFRRIDRVDTISKPGYGKITQLTLDKPWLAEGDRLLSTLRQATIYAQNERLALADESMTEDIYGQEIPLDDLYDGLETGRWLIVSGERTDIPGTTGVRASELVMLAGVIQQVEQTTSADQDSKSGDLPGGKTKTVLLLAGNGLNYTYRRDTVTIYGNVVKATHGETRQEVLGSGDGSRARQTFALKQKPLTYLAAATPTGAQSTLELRVNNILWHEAENLIWLDADQRGYITRADDQENTTLVFGDGQHGARLPTGIENVRAVYRNGLGKVGNVAAQRISLLATKPLGVKSVVNPLPATGGADRERRDQARRNAPLAVMALDRLVSIQDYADFARAYAGIDKAHAVRLSDGQHEIILLTIAGADDIPISPLSDLYQYLCQALNRFGAPNRVIKVLPRELMLLIISAKIRLDPDYQWEFVAPAVRTALLEAFSFDQRQLGQDVLLAEVISTIQSVPGVIYVDVDVMDSISEHIPPEELQQLADSLTVGDRIRSEVGRIQTTHVVGRSNETLSSIAQRYGIREVELRQLNPKVQDPISIGTELVIPRQVRPAQLAYLSPDVPDTLVLTELT